MNKCFLKIFLLFDQVKYGGATYTRIDMVTGEMMWTEITNLCRLKKSKL